MAKRKPAEYVHCAKCGYRGVDQAHDCTKVRAAAAAIVEQAARREPSAGYTASYSIELAPTSHTPLRLSQYAVDHSRIFGRHITYVEVLNERGVIAPATTIEIHQRCSACSSDLVKRTRIDLADPLSGMQLGATARKEYLLHRCPPAETSLVGLTYEELEQLHAELERDGTKMIERAAAIDAIRKARVG